MSPDMRRWLDDDSDAGALTNPAALAASSATAAALAAEPLPPAQTTLFSGSHVDPGASAAASSITSAAATRTPPTFTDSSDDFDSFLEAAKVRSSAPAQIESILPPVVSTPATFGSNDVASSMEPPPLSVGDDDQWGGFLSPELMQATINAGSVLE
ncbi:hypothetical protein CAOG_004563 [Capsaspora owczarzaki ATCC 30864]|uniref:Uncharacterized protein n=2 Tax=Capsaspora owczarzaki (strain ATCC 30864) TaxID=595528 RepID=A0A0D2VS34_CAPO3|nr:hypothetical protein CAOG_004563 [Capsaspora owczarzaki ATCC 30864]